MFANLPQEKKAAVDSNTPITGNVQSFSVFQRYVTNFSAEKGENFSKQDDYDVQSTKSVGNNSRFRKYRARYTSNIIPSKLK